ncbi:MAG: ABC transporter ATP-binding protein [Massilia sp.]
MILLDNVSKRYRTRQGYHTVLDGVDLTVRPGEKIGILGRNGSGKSTLIRLISGAEPPTSGIVMRTMSVSWPLALADGFQGTLTGLDNLRFICRVYGVSTEDKIAWVEDFTELGKFFREPVKHYSAGMRARLAFALSMVIEFDCFLIDEVISVGDKRFHDKCRHELFDKRRERAMIMVSHEIHNIYEFCDRACVIADGRLRQFGQIDDAVNFYHEHQKAESLHHE